MFSLTSPALLAFDKERAEGNWQTLYGMDQVPCDTHMREILAPVSPESLRPVCKSVLRQLQRGTALEALVFFADGYLWALNGTGYFSSQTMHCASCLQKVHRTGSLTYFHQMLGAAIIHPDMRAVIPLMPEPMVKQEGADKNDCERNAAKRFVAKLRQAPPHLKCIVTADSLSAHAPHSETLHAHALHYLLGVKEGDPAYLFTQVQAAERAGHVTSYERHDRAAGLVHRFRFVNDVPLNESHAAVRVNFIEYGERGAAKVQHFSGVTDLRVSKGNVYRLMRGGRARWKIENETFNTLKNHGYHFCTQLRAWPAESCRCLCHADDVGVFGGSDPAALSCLVASGMGKTGQQTPLVGAEESVVLDSALESMRHLLAALFYGLQKPNPIFALDSS